MSQDARFERAVAPWQSMVCMLRLNEGQYFVARPRELWTFFPSNFEGI